MNNIKILGICIKGFKGFEEEVIYKFPTIHSVIGGKNAQGKSSIGDAICWALYGSDINNSDKDAELLNIHSEEMYVTVEIDIDGNILRIARIKKNVITLKMNGKKITQKALNEYLPSKKLFMSIFNANNFLDLIPSKAREQLLSIIPYSDPREILEKNNCLGKLEIINKYEDINLGILTLSKNITVSKNNINIKIGEKNTIENLLEESKMKNTTLSPVDLNIERSISELEKDLFNMNSLKPNLLDKQEVLNKLRENELLISIEHNKHYINDTDTMSVIQNELSNLKGQYVVLKSSLNKIYSHGPVCNECGQSIPEEHKHSQEKELNYQMECITNSANELNETIEIIKYLDIENKNSFKDEKNKVLNTLLKTKQKYEEQLNNIDNINKVNQEKFHKEISVKKLDLDEKLYNLKSVKEDYRKQLQEVEMIKLNIDKYTEMLSKVNLELDNLTKILREREIEKVCLTEYNVMYVDYITGILSLWLTDVCIELYKINKSTGEVKEDFKVLYRGKSYNRISNSERLKVGLEICNMFNMSLDIKYPIFVDNAECILDLPIIDTQMIIAKVVDSELNIVKLNNVVEENTSLNAAASVENILKEKDTGAFESKENKDFFTGIYQESLLD